MKLFRIFGPSCCVLLLSSCQPPKLEVDFSKISVGMSKEEVINKIGVPSRIAASGAIEYFEYEAYDIVPVGPSTGQKYNIRLMFVRFTNQRVEAFGRKGDFDSTKNPTTEQKIDLKISGDGNPSDVQSKSKFDLASELKKLDELLKSGLITQSEYETLRQRAIDKARIN